MPRAAALNVVADFLTFVAWRLFEMFGCLPAYYTHEYMRDQLILGYSVSASLYGKSSSASKKQLSKQSSFDADFKSEIYLCRLQDRQAFPIALLDFVCLQHFYPSEHAAPAEIADCAGLQSLS